MPPYTFTRGYSAVSRVYHLASELCRENMLDADTRIRSISLILPTLSDAGSLLAREGACGIDSCRTALAELQFLIVGLGPSVSPELATALPDAVSIFAEPADVLASNGLPGHQIYMHEGFAHHMPPLLSELTSPEDSVNPDQIHGQQLLEELLKRYAEETT